MSLLFILQLLVDVPHCDQCCHYAKQKQGREGYASPPQLPLAKYLHYCVPPAGVVLEQSLQLEHGAQGQEQMEDLVAVAHNVTVTREEALGDGKGEEEGGEKEGDNLESVEGQRWLICPGDGEQAVGYGADVQKVCQGGRDQLADFALQWVWPSKL